MNYPPTRNLKSYSNSSSDSSCGLYRRKNFEKINLLKIDTQGYEPEVLCGMRDHLKRVDVVISELMFYDFMNEASPSVILNNIFFQQGFNFTTWSYIKNPIMEEQTGLM